MEDYMPSTAWPTPPDKLHDIDLEEGYFSQTKAQDLIDAFDNFRHSKPPQRNHICVFFHGGLVSRAEGLDTAHRLIIDYTKAGAYPFFFIWNSSLRFFFQTTFPCLMSRQTMFPNKSRAYTFPFRTMGVAPGPRA